MKLFTGLITVFLALCSTAIAAQSRQNCNQINEYIHVKWNQKELNWPRYSSIVGKYGLTPDVVKKIDTAWENNRYGLGPRKFVYDKRGRRIELKIYYSQIVITQICPPNQNRWQRLKRRRRLGLNFLGDRIIEIPKPFDLPETVCQEPFLGSGSCRAAFRRWYFDIATSTCKQFIYGGCDGNDNNFKSEKDCQSVCGAGESKNNQEPIINPEPIPDLDQTSRCQEEFLGSGSCRAAFRRWHFDTATSTCKQFIYGGCDGNGNNFANEDECKTICEATQQEPLVTEAPEQIQTTQPANNKGQPKRGKRRLNAGASNRIAGGRQTKKPKHRRVKQPKAWPKRGKQPNLRRLKVSTMQNGGNRSNSKNRWKNSLIKKSYPTVYPYAKYSNSKNRWKNSLIKKTYPTVYPYAKYSYRNLRNSRLGQNFP